MAKLKPTDTEMMNFLEDAAQKAWADELPLVIYAPQNWLTLRDAIADHLTSKENV